MFQFILRFSQIMAFYLVLLWLALMLLVGNFFVFFLYYLLPRRKGKSFGRKLNSFVFKLFLRGCSAFGLMHLDLQALDKLSTEKGIIIAPNHPSMIDVFLVLSRIKNASCLMKASLWNNVLLGSGARLAGYVNNNSVTKMVRDSIYELQCGSNLLIFPEGTRTVNVPVNRLMAGIGLISAKAQAPVQTVLLQTDSPYLSKHWPIWKVPPFPIQFKATVGKRFEPTTKATEMVVLLQNYYDSTLDELFKKPLTSYTQL